jgi:hypothetical protein
VHRPFLRQVITKPIWTQDDGRSPYSKMLYIIVGVDKCSVGHVGQETFQPYIIVNLGVLAEWVPFFGQRAVSWIAAVANNYTAPPIVESLGGHRWLSKLPT